MQILKTIKYDGSTLANRLAMAQKETKKPIYKVCEEAGLKSTAYWYKLMRGDYETVNYETAEKLCQAVGLKLADVMGEQVK